MTKPMVTSQPMRLPDRLRLPFTFDPVLLLRDLQSLSGIAWIDHCVPQNYDGEWSVIPLRANADARQQLVSAPVQSAQRSEPELVAAQTAAKTLQPLARRRCPANPSRIRFA
jgi:hypothetical protein